LSWGRLARSEATALGSLLLPAPYGKRERTKKRIPQQSQRSRATLHVVENFAKSLKITQDHLKLHRE